MGLTEEQIKEMIAVVPVVAAMAPICFWHGPEPSLPGDYKACMECVHVWRSQESFEADCEAAGINPIRAFFCPLCTHDF